MGTRRRTAQGRQPDLRYYGDLMTFRATPCVTIRGIFETLWLYCHMAGLPSARTLQQRANRSRRADPPPQPLYRHAIDPAQRRYWHFAAPHQQTEPHRTQHRRTAMAQRREHRRDESQPHPAPRRAPQIRPVMHRGCCAKATAPSYAPSYAPSHPPTPPAQMNARPHRLREPPIARHHQHQPPLPTHTRQASRQRRPVRPTVVAQHHPTQTLRQPRRRRHRIGDPPSVGEQP